MTNEKKQEKVKRFFEIVKKMQNSERMAIGLLILKKNDDMTNIVDNVIKKQSIKLIEVNKEEDSQKIINEMTSAFEKGQGMALRLSNTLDAMIYNQLDIISQAGHMEYPTKDERKFVYPTKGSYLVLISTDQELESMNYTNIFNLVTLTERLP